MTAILQLHELRRDFHGNRGLMETIRRAPKPVVHAVRGVSLDIAHGQTVGLVGESGSGKTTLGRMVAGLISPTSGSILFDGEDITQPTRDQQFILRRRIQIVFQDPYASLNPRHRIGDMIREPLDIHKVGTAAARRTRVSELMELVALPARYAMMYPHQLSGGLRQRVCIATALALDPVLLVADEPVSALDVSVQAQILDLLESIQRETGISMLFISHDLGVVQQVSDVVAVMRRGQILEAGPVDQVYENPQNQYTKALLSAIPPADPTARYAPIPMDFDDATTGAAATTTKEEAQ